MKGNNRVLIAGPCDLRCWFCISPGSAPPQADTPLPALFAELARIRADGHSSVQLGVGGFEPTTYPHFDAVVRKCRDLGFSRIELSTSGMATASLAFLKQLKNAGLTHIAVTLFSSRPETMDLIGGGSGVLENRLLTLRNAAELGVTTIPLVMLLSQSVRELDAVLDLVAPFLRAEEQGGPSVQVSVPVFTGDFSTYRLVAPAFPDTSRAVLAASVARSDWCFTTSNIPRCAWPADTDMRHILLNYPGWRVGPAPGMDASVTSRFLYQQIPECSDCPQQNSCPGIQKTYLEIWPDYKPWGVTAPGSLPGSEMDQITVSLVAQAETLSHAGWKFLTAHPDGSGGAVVCFTSASGGRESVSVRPGEQAGGGYCVTSRYALSFSGPPGSRMPKAFETLIHRIEKIIRAVESME